MTKANTWDSSYFFLTFVMVLSLPPVTCSGSLVNVREALFLAEVVEVTAPPVLLFISLSLLDCGCAEYSSACTFSTQVGCLVLRMFPGLGRHDSFTERSRQQIQNLLYMYLLALTCKCTSYTLMCHNVRFRCKVYLSCILFHSCTERKPYLNGIN